MKVLIIFFVTIRKIDRTIAFSTKKKKTSRCSSPEVLCRKATLKNFVKFTGGETAIGYLFFIKVADLKLLEMILYYRADQ